MLRCRIQAMPEIPKPQALCHDLEGLGFRFREPPRCPAPEAQYDPIGAQRGHDAPPLLEDTP